jgi:Fic family protein
MIFRTPKVDPKELEVIAKIDEIRKKLQNTLRTTYRWTGFLRRNMIAKNIQGSNTIEGYNVTFEEAVAVVEGEQIDANVETRLALEGYRKALTYIMRLSDDQDYTFNEELIRSLHYMMMSHNETKHPGQWRPGPIYVRREPSGERVYEGPDAVLIPSLMHEFVKSVQECDDTVPVVVRAAMAHLNLVMIHPFSDGNGRMGRTVQTFVLTKDGILSPPFSSIEEYLGSRSNTDSYYTVLADVGVGSWHPESDARPWVRFCLHAHLQQAVTIDRRVKEIARLWSDLESEIEHRGLHERVINALFDAAIGFAVRSERYSKTADVSGQVASRDLRSLVESGLLTAKGEKRGRIYFASPFLIALRDKTREIKKPLPSDIFKEQLNLF